MVYRAGEVMAKFRITGPDGGMYEVNAPDDATEDQVLSYVQQNTQGRSFAQPKLSAPPEPSAMADVGQQAVRGINRGVNAALSLPGELIGGAVNMVAPGEGDRFKWNNPVSELMSSPDAQPQTDAGRYANSVGQMVGGNIIPGAGIAAKARQVAPAATTTLGAIGQQVVNSYRTAPGAAVATDLVAATGAGIGQQVAEDLETGPTGKVIGAIAGSVAPFGAIAAGNRLGDAFARSPIAARYRTTAHVAEASPQSAGAAVNPTLAAGDPAPPISGPDAAAYQHLANRLSEAGVRPGTIGQRLERSDIDAVGGRSPLGLVDLDPSLQRLAGSLVRQSQEAGNRGQRFVAGRQTGITPLEGMPANSGIPTREFMEQGTPIDPASGMFERMRDNVRAFLQVPQRSAYRVDQDLIDVQRTQSRPAYRQTFDAAQGIDMTPAITPLLQRWQASLANEVDAELIGRMRTVINTVNRAIAPGGTVSHYERLNSAKKAVDKFIDRANRSSEQRSPEVVRALTGMKNELLAVMDSVPNVGNLYQGARSVFGSTAELRNALELGRNALKEGSEVSADAYRAMSLGEQQMFRVGLADTTERAMAGQKRGADVTQIFQKPNVQELLMEVMPQDQAQRFGRNIQTENMTTRTTNEVFGNSKTAQRAADDEAFNQMGDAIEAIRSTKEAVRSSRSMADAGFNVLKGILERVGGFRADTATALANKLFTADRAELDTIIREVEARMGPTRSAHFRSMLDRYSANMARQSAAGAVVVAQPGQQQQSRRAQQNDLFQRPPGYLPPDPKPRQP